MSEPLLKVPCVFGENGNFLLERQLGAGGMGGVYMGRDKMLDRPVAVKVMLKEYGDDAEFVEKFKKEAQAAARLIHPNIAQIYSYGISEGMPYIAMELVAGGSLWTIMQANGNRTDVTRVLKICQQVAQALQCSSDMGYVHGDIKPENILLDANGNAKLVDFGLAGMQKDTEEIWGTPYYIAPEKVRQTGVDFRSDMYNLGGTLYHALTGMPPFDGEDVAAVVKARFFGAPKKPSERRPDLTPQVDALVMRMLEEDREKRFPSFEALIAEFKKVLTSGLDAQAPAEEKKSEGDGAEKPKAATGTGTRVVRKTATGRRMVTRRRVSTVKKLDEPAEDADAEAAAKESKKAEEDDDEEGGGNLGVKVALAIVGGLLVIGGIIGGLLWFQAADKKSREREHREQIVGGITKARNAVNDTRKTAAKFADEFDEFANKAIMACKKTTEELKKLLPDWADEMQPPPSRELLDAIASTNETPVAAAPAPAPRPAATNAAPAAAKPAVTNAAPVAKGAAKPAATNAVAKAGKKADAKPAEKAEEKVEEKKPEKQRPAVLDDVKELWERAYSCQASAIRIRHGVRKLLKECAAADEIKGEDRESMDKLAGISRKVADAYSELRNSKDVENVSSGITYIKQKGEKTIQKTTTRLRIERLEAERKARKDKEAAEELERREAAAAAKLKLVEEESEAAKAKFEALVAQDVFKQLDWKNAIRQLETVKNECKTPEGALAVGVQLRKVKAMQSVQEIFVKNLNGYVFRKSKLKKSKVKKVDATQLDLVKPDGKTSMLTWVKFYQGYHGNLNELVNVYVVGGRENAANPRNKLGLKDWADAMCGAALTMQIVCSDDASAAARGEQLVKQAVEAFPDYAKTVKDMFPDMKLEVNSEE